MMGAFKGTYLAATLLLAMALAPTSAKAQFAPLGGTGGNMMTQMAPMIEMIKAKMGKRRFAMMMQTMGPMMSRMMEGGAMPGIGGFGGGAGFVPDGFGGNDVAGILGGNGGEMIGMIPQIVQMVGGLSGGHGRRHRRRHM